MERYISEGRSTPGAAQKNDFALSLDGGLKGKKARKAKNGKDTAAGDGPDADQ